MKHTSKFEYEGNKPCTSIINETEISSQHFNLTEKFYLQLTNDLAHRYCYRPHRLQELEVRATLPLS